MNVKELTSEQILQFVQALETNGWWKIIENAIDESIKFYESNIFSIDDDNDKKFTKKDLFIARRKCLIDVKELPSKLSATFSSKWNKTVEEVLNNWWMF